MSKGTEISVARFLIEYFTPLKLGEKHQGALSVRRTKGGVKGVEVHCPDEKEVEKTFWISKFDGASHGWVINKKTKHIIMFECKCDSDTVETYYADMKSIEERRHTPILEGLNVLTEERGWVVEVLRVSSGPTVFGQGKRVTRDHEDVCQFGIITEDGKESFTG